MHGEEVKKLDEYAHEVIFKALDHTGYLCCMASEEAEDPIEIPAQFPTGKYALLYDPLDGSSNIDSNVPIGTIFSIDRKISNAERGSLEDLLPTFNRLKEKSPSARMVWFQNGKVWNSRVEAQEAMFARGERGQEYYLGDFWIEDASTIEVKSERKAVGPIWIFRQRSGARAMA